MILWMFGTFGNEDEPKLHNANATKHLRNILEKCVRLEGGLIKVNKI